MGLVIDSVKTFLYRDGIPVPAGFSFVGATDPSALKIIHNLYSGLKVIRNKKCWTVQKRKHSFDLEASRTQYPLPQDFFAPLPQSHWDRDNVEMLIGPMSDSSFGYRLYGVASDTGIIYRLFGPDRNPNTTTGQFEIYPADASGGRTISFEYLTSNLFLPKHWLPSTAYTSGIYVNVNGNIYVCDTNGTSSTTPPSTQTANITDGTTQWDYVSTAYETVLADTDINLFDDEVVELALRAKWLESSGEDHSRAYAELEARMEDMSNRYTGSYFGSRLAIRSSWPRNSLPPGNW